MNRKYIMMAVCILMAVLYSCKNEDLFSTKDQNKIGTYEMSLQEAEQFLFDFAKNDLKTKGGSSLELIKAEKKYYQIGFKVDTKAEKSIEECVPVYEFTIKNDKDDGFALVLSDKRIKNVLAYSLRGTLNDTIFNLGLKYFVHAIPGHIRHSLNDYSTNSVNVTKSGNEENITYHYCEIPIKWGQGYPFNADVPLSCSDVDLSYHGKAPAGCVAIGVAQIMAFHRQPQNFNWNLLLGSTYITENSPITMRIEAAKLVADIGYKVNMSYGCGGSGSTLANARIALGKYGYHTDVLDNYNVQRIISSINSDFPVLLSGDDGSVGHLWVVDGRRSSTIDGVSQNWLQMNWGWNGSADGWYYCYEPAVFEVLGYEFYRNLSFLGNIEYWN